MGTFELISSLYSHWHRPISPVYKNDQRYGPPWKALPLDRLIGRAVKGLLILGLIALVLVALRVITEQAFMSSLSNALLQFLCLGAAGLVAIVLMGLTFIWPLAVSLTTSGTIVREREHRTWSALLTTPLDWNDLLTAKLASALRWWTRPMEVLMWVQGVCVLFVFIIIIAQVDRVIEDMPAALTVAIAILGSIQFTIARFQDYTTATVIGLGASMASETQQMATVISLMVSLGMMILRVALTAILLGLTQFTAPPSPQGIALLLVTGPTTSIVLALSKAPILIIVLLVGLPIVRELLIRQSYRVILDHLGVVAGNG